MTEAHDFENWDEMLNHASLGVHLVDGEGNILWVNDKELEFLGYSREEYVGHSIMDFHVDRDVIEQILAILTGGGMLQTYPARLRTKSGELKHVLINSNVYSKNNKFVHTRCFTSPTSEAVYTQLRLEQLESQND